jgi:hypothetical protein
LRSDRTEQYVSPPLRTPQLGQLIALLLRLWARDSAQIMTPRPVQILTAESSLPGNRVAFQRSKACSEPASESRLRDKCTSEACAPRSGTWKCDEQAQENRPRCPGVTKWFFPAEPHCLGRRRSSLVDADHTPQESSRFRRTRAHPHAPFCNLLAVVA